MNLGAFISDFSARSSYHGVYEKDLIEVESKISTANAKELFQIASSPNYHVRKILSEEINNRLKKARYSYETFNNDDEMKIRVSYDNSDQWYLFPFSLSLSLAKNEQLLLSPFITLFVLSIESDGELILTTEERSKYTSRAFLDMDEEYAFLLRIFSILLKTENGIGKRIIIDTFRPI